MQELLLQQAMLGTDRSPNVTGYFKESGESFADLDKYIVENESSKARKTLLAGGVWSLFDQTGQIPKTVSPQILREALAPGLEEETSANTKKISLPLSRLLQLVFEHFFETPAIPLLYMKKMVDAGFMLPPRLFPTIFDLLTKRNAYKRDDILDPLMGPAGRWLAKLNPAWQWYGAAENLEEGSDKVVKTKNNIWEDGTFSERLAFLKRMRQESPEEARELLNEVWKGEKADKREAFLVVFKENLGPADLPFLEKAMVDRATGVRSNAMTLCGCLPDSSFYKVVTEYAATLLSFEASSPIIQFPDEFTPEMKKFGIIEKAPPQVGVHSWWFLQWMELVPLAYWEERFQKTPDEILQMFSEDDNFISLLIGWGRSVCRYKGPDSWLLPLWGWWISMKKNNQRCIYEEMEQNLLTLCLIHFPDEFFKRFNNCFQSNSYYLSQVFTQLAETHPIPWSDSFASIFCEYLLQLKSNDFMLKYAALLPPPLMLAVRRNIEQKVFSPSGLTTSPKILQDLEHCENFNRRLEQEIARKGNSPEG